MPPVWRRRNRLDLTGVFTCTMLNFHVMKVTARLAVAGLLPLCAAGCVSLNRASPQRTVSPHPAHRANCTVGQLGAAMKGSSQPGTGGTGLALIYIWDTSATACTLTSPVTIAGMNRAGQQVTDAVRFAIAPGSAPLSPHGSGPGTLGRLPAHEAAAAMLLIAAGPNPAAGLTCAAHQVTPARWRISLSSGGSITVANASPVSGIALTRTGGLTACGRRVGGQSPITIPG